MEHKPDYAFPLYHRIGLALRPVLSSKYWIVIVLAITVLLYLPFLPSGFFQDDFGFRLQFAPEIYEKSDIPAETMQNSPLDLYGFSRNASERLMYQQNLGFAPWWADENIKTNFFRPFSSLTLALDFTLWPDSPMLMHLHSLLWFCLLIVLAERLYRSVSGSIAVAGVSILLLAVDDVMSGPVGWISNRHAVIAMVFVVLCIWLYREGVANRNWRCIAGACGVYALALLASEMGLVAFAYLFACLLILDRDRWLVRAARIAPFILITIIWRLAYTALGYGSSGTLLYIDPLFEPAYFLSQMLTRIPVLLFSAAGLPMADFLLAASPQILSVIAIVFTVLLGALAFIVYPVLRTHRAAAFWALGTLLAVIPLVTGIPQTRNLGLVSLGIMGLAGQLFVDVAKAVKTDALTTFRRILLKLSLPLLLILHLIVAPLVVITSPATTRLSTESQAAAADFGSAPELANQHVHVVNPPGVMSFMAGLFQRLFTDAPFPKTIHYLSSGFSSVNILRMDERTILVTPEGGYTPLPGPVIDKATGMETPMHMENVYRALDGFFYNPRNPMRKGQIVILKEVTVEVTAVTGDGRIAQAIFTFAESLEDGRYVWLWWNESTSAYERVSMPQVGEERIYP